MNKSTRNVITAVASTLALTCSQAYANEKPGQGIKVFPLKSSVTEETFQTLIVIKALEELGYDVQPIQEVDYPAAHLALSNGDATFMAVHWNPLHSDFYKNSGGDAKLVRKGAFIDSAAQGYLIDKKTADQYKITNISQLQNPEIAKLFDANGDGKADLTGCNPGWGCEAVLEHHLDAYNLRKTVIHNQGNYSALIGDTIARFKSGQPILYYTWTPFWVSNELKPGKDVVWLEVPFSSAPGEQKGMDSTLPNGKNYGFVVNKQQIISNKVWTEKNPAAAKLFEIMQIPLNDVNAQNYLMTQGQGKPSDIEGHANNWIKAHKETFDGWIKEASQH